MVNKYSFFVFAALICATAPALAEQDISMNTAQMQAMDKITGRVSIIEVPVNGEIKFGSFSVVIRSCKTRPQGQIPENFAFVDISDKSFDQKEYNIFKGWMFSSKPSVNAVEHPIYDVWLLKCLNKEEQTANLLSAEELAARDQLPRLQDIQEQTKTADLKEEISQPRQNITFKDSMYYEKSKPVQETDTPVKADGAPENLLNIKESYEDVDEEIVTLPSETLTESIQQEAQGLQQLQPVTDELAQAIDKELAEQTKE